MAFLIDEGLLALIRQDDHPKIDALLARVVGPDVTYAGLMADDAVDDRHLPPKE